MQWLPRLLRLDCHVLTSVTSGCRAFISLVLIGLTALPSLIDHAGTPYGGEHWDQSLAADFPPYYSLCLFRVPVLLDCLPLSISPAKSELGW